MEMTYKLYQPTTAEHTTTIKEHSHQHGYLFERCLQLSHCTILNFEQHSSKTVKIIIIFILKSGLAVLTGLLSLCHQIQIDFTKMLNLDNSSNIYFFLLLFVLALQLLQLISMMIIVIKKGKQQFISQTLIRIINSFHIVNEITLLASGVLMVVRFVPNIGCFVISGCLNLFGAVFLQNYIVRSDQLYCASAAASVFFKCLQIVGFALTSVFYNYFLQYYKYCMVLQFLSFAMWYVWMGQYSYIHPLTKNCFLVMVGINSSVYTVGLQNYILHNSQHYLQFGPIFLILLVNIFLCFNLHNSSTFDGCSQLHPQQLKITDTEIKQIVQTQPTNVQNLNVLYGMLKCHQQKQCSNKHCYSYNLVMYDPLIFQVVPVQGKTRSVATSCRYYMKCCYERALDLQPTNIELSLNCMQFIYNQFSNPFAVMFICQRIEGMNLGVLQRVKLCKMKQLLAVKLQNFNLNQRDGSICFQKVIESQIMIQQIQRNILSYLFQNMTVWQCFKQKHMDLTYIRNKLHACFKLLNNLSIQWQNVMQHLNVHTRWLYLFLNYSLYLQNKKPNSKTTQLLNCNRNQKNLFQNNKIYYESIDKLPLFKKKQLLFHQQCFSLHAIYQNQQLLIAKTSQNAINYIGYTQKQIKNSALQLLLPTDVKQRHNQIFMKWSEGAFAFNQKSYNSHFSCIVNKNGTQIPVIKIYKLFINQDSVQYVCLCKVNIKLTPQTIMMDYISKANQERQRKRLTGLQTLIHRTSNLQAAQLTKIKQQTKIWSLIIENNLFIKQQNLNAVQQIAQITQIKFMTRLFNFCLLMTIIVLTLITNQQATDMLHYSNQYINFMQTYRMPMVLGNNYFKSVLKIGNQTKVNAQINSLTILMQKVSQTPQILKTLFDPIINKPQSFTPAFINSVNRGMSYDQIQLFYLIRQCIVSISRLPISPDSTEFQQFNAYIKPGYDTLINGTKNSFHLTFQKLFANITIKQIYVLITQTILFIVFLFVCVIIINTFFNRLKEVIHIILQLKEDDLSLIYHYWCHLFLLFETITLKIKGSNTDIQLNSSQLRRKEFDMTDNYGNDRSSTMNRPVKHLKDHKQSIRFKAKLVMLLIIGMLLPTVIILTCETTIVNSIKQLSAFELDGFAFLKYFPTATLVGYGCLQKLYSLNYSNYTHFNPKRYEDVLASMRMVGEFQYIGQVKDVTSNYYQKQRNYFFGNPCLFNSSVLIGVGIDSTKCQTIINNSFSRGLASYMREGHALASAYIQGRSNLTIAQLDEFSLSVSVLSAYILDAITTWGMQFNVRVEALVGQVMMTSIINTCLVIILHFLLFQLLMFQQLKKQYQFYGRAYNCMMPQYVLLREKVTRQKLILTGIIERE